VHLHNQRQAQRGPVSGWEQSAQLLFANLARAPPDSPSSELILRLASVDLLQ
jgi:hypothetical protein